MKAAIIGGGVIGGGWAARFLLNGWDVAVYDSNPAAFEELEKVLARAKASLPGLLDVSLPAAGQLLQAETLEAAVAGADWVQESVPERIEIKHQVIRDIQEVLAEGVPLGSSTSGFSPSQLQEGAVRPGQIFVAHPFNPVYLIPLVEVVGSAANAGQLLDTAHELLETVGFFPLRVRKEIDAHIADRLLEAVWREALWLVRDGIATTEDIDEAIRMGFGLRWAQMGLFETYRCAGGPEGMRHFMAQFGPALEWPWTRLMDVPPFDDALVDLIAAQSDAQSGDLSIDGLLDLRDRNLVSILRALKAQDAGAGQVLNRQEARLRAGSVLGDPSGLIETCRRVVPLDWVDYNGHMNEAKYLQAFGDATDRFMAMIGCDGAYIAAGQSYFTVETHIRHLDEVLAGKEIAIRTQLLDGGGRKLHLFHEMWAGDVLAATGEHFLLHVSLETRATCEAGPALQAAVARIAAVHEALPWPEGAGRAVGQRG